jgi:hypothetical protein
VLLVGCPTPCSRKSASRAVLPRGLPKKTSMEANPTGRPRAVEPAPTRRGSPEGKHHECAPDPPRRRRRGSSGGAMNRASRRKGSGVERNVSAPVARFGRPRTGPSCVLGPEAPPKRHLRVRGQGRPSRLAVGRSPGGSPKRESPGRHRPRQAPGGTTPRGRADSRGELRSEAVPNKLHPPRRPRCGPKAAPEGGRP